MLTNINYTHNALHGYDSAIAKSAHRTVQPSLQQALQRKISFVLQ